jgi:homoprotocatechuate degradation regulator HpaR
MGSSSGRFRHRNLPMLLLQARERVIARFRPILNANGVTEQQWRIVRALNETGPLEPREIGKMCQISSPSLAGVLARMEDLDYVKRKRLDHDQRRVQVSLTPRSRALCVRMAPQVETVYRDIENVIGVEFSARFYRALDELIGALATGGGETAADE